MLLTANLYRASARSLKTFSSGRIDKKSGKAKEVETVPFGENPTGSLMEFSQLQVNMANLKFRRIKSKNGEQEIASESVAECREGAAEANNSDGSSVDVMKLHLGDSKSDFERWLDGCQSIQMTEKSDFVDFDKMDSHHDSAISSCNASDCCEEDKEDKLISMEWNEGKLSEKIAAEGGCGCSSGYHSMTASYSNATSGSEAVSPTCMSPKMSQETFSLEEELNIKMADLPLTQLVFDGDSYYEMPVIENQFQVVQNKKMRSKSKNVVPSAKPVRAANTFNNKTSGNIRKPVKNNFSDVRDHKCKSENVHSPTILSENLPNNVVIPQSSNIKNVSSNDSISAETMRDNKTSAKKRGRKNRQNRKGKTDDTSLNASEVSEVDHNIEVHHHEVHAAEINPPQSDIGATDLASNSDASKREKESSNAATTSVNVDISKVVSFGRNCGDLDTFVSPTPTDPQLVDDVTREDSRPVRRQFNLRKAQLFLMEAYKTVQKQQMEDSRSVFIYSRDRESQAIRVS